MFKDPTLVENSHEKTCKSNETYFSDLRGIPEYTGTYNIHIYLMFYDTTPIMILADSIDLCLGVVVSIRESVFGSVWVPSALITHPSGKSKEEHIIVS